MPLATERVLSFGFIVYNNTQYNRSRAIEGLYDLSTRSRSSSSPGRNKIPTPMSKKKPLLLKAKVFSDF